MKKALADRQLNFLVAVNALILATAVGLIGTQFVNAYNLQSMATQIPELGLLAIGVALAMISGNGGIDLSGIALANLSSLVAALAVRSWIPADDAPMAFSIAFAAVCMCGGLVGGLINGLLISRAGMTPIIATLGTSLAFTGLALVLTNGSAVKLGYIEPLDNFANSSVLGVPICFALFIAIAVLIGCVLRFTPFGFRLYLLGSNPKAARYAGFAPRRLVLVTYTLCGLLASVAGVIIGARISSLKWDYGTSYVLIAILIVVMAGVRPEGGYGRIVCVVVSATALQLLSTTFNFLNITNFFRDCALGLLLLIFLAVSRVNVGAIAFPASRHR
jgi:simple sugar transport system permease protein